jgi:hypothetical protein
MDPPRSILDLKVKLLEHQHPPSKLIGGVPLSADPHQGVVVSYNNEMAPMEVVLILLDAAHHHQALPMGRGVVPLSVVECCTSIGHHMLMAIIVNLGKDCSHCMC